MGYALEFKVDNDVYISFAPFMRPESYRTEKIPVLWETKDILGTSHQVVLGYKHALYVTLNILDIPDSTTLSAVLQQNPLTVRFTSLQDREDVEINARAVNLSLQHLHSGEDEYGHNRSWTRPINLYFEEL